MGVDVGTTMTKAAVVTADGEEVAWGSVPTPWHPVPTGAEIGPLEILDAVARAVSTALELAPAGPVVGLGVTSMAETMALLDINGEPVAPAIAWHDTRGEEETADLVRVFGEQTFSGRTGLAPSHICTLVKLAWRSRHQGSSAACALSVADWVVHALGGERVSEASLASRTGAPFTGRAEVVGGGAGMGGRAHQPVPARCSGRRTRGACDRGIVATLRRGHGAQPPGRWNGSGVAHWHRPAMTTSASLPERAPSARGRCSTPAVRQKHWSGRWRRLTRTSCAGQWLQA